MLEFIVKKIPFGLMAIAEMNYTRNRGVCF
jgi:hypothetical protein